MIVMRIGKLRIQKNMSQNQLSILSGLSRPTIQYLESGGNNPTLRTLIALAQALDVEVTDL